MKTKADKGFPRQSNIYVQTLDGVLARATEQQLVLVAEDYVEARRFVLDAVHALGGNRVHAYVKDFLKKHFIWPYPRPADDDEDDHEEDGQA